MESTIERGNYVFIARLAKQAGRYHEMVEAMNNLAKLDVKLTVEERNLLSVGYKHFIGSRRTTWRILSSIEQKEDWKGNELNVKRIRDYRKKVESELSTIYNDIMTVINEHLIPSSKAGESTAFYYKMKGDFYRYLAELKSGSERKEAVDQSMKAYEFVLVLQGSMPTTTTSSSTTTTPELRGSMPFGFAGADVESCPADKPMRQEFQIIEEKSLKRKNNNSDSAKISKHFENSQMNLISQFRTLPKDEVDEKVARFFFAGGLDINIVNSPYFCEMLKAVGAFGPRYELPSREVSEFYLSKEKAKLEKSINQIRESWPHTACTIICVNRVGSSLGCLSINLFVSSCRGVMFMQSIDIDEDDGAESQFINALSDAIIDIGHVNVIQVITLLGQASFAFESVMSSKYPHIFWSHCTSHSIRTLLEEIAELDFMKAVVLCARGVEKTVLSYQCSSSNVIYNSEDNSNAPFSRFAPSYCLVQRIHHVKGTLKEFFISNDWKQWKLTASDDAAYIEEAVLGDEFWSRAELMLHLYEPFLTLLVKFNIDKSNMGDVYNWKVQSLETMRSKGVDDIVLHHMEMLIDSRWDMLFSPLHAAGYMLNPRYFGRGQVKDKIVMRGWKATLEKYEPESAARRLLREQLSTFWRVEGSLGGEDAVESRDKMDPVTWWETFGFETPNLQKLAIKVLSQVSSVSFYQENILRELSAGQARKEMRILYLSETILDS